MGFIFFYITDNPQLITCKFHLNEVVVHLHHIPNNENFTQLSQTPSLIGIHHLVTGRN